MDSPLLPIDQARAALRASDIDRERVAARLQENYSTGRLSYDEFQERLEQAYGSKTLGELGTLTRDLPAEGETTAPANPIPPASTAGRAKRVRDRVLTYVVIMLFLIAIWAATGAHGSFWPIWPILIGGLILAFDLLGLERPGSTRRQYRLERDRYRAERRERRRERRRGRDNGTE